MYEEVERHEMELVRLHPNGAEEWFCPTCQRRFIMQWPPNYRRIVLETGNENAVHSGGRNGAFSTADGGSPFDADRAIDKQSLFTGDGTLSGDGYVDLYSNERGYDGIAGLSPLFLDAIDELDFSPLDNLEGAGGEE